MEKTQVACKGADIAARAVLPKSETDFIAENLRKFRSPVFEKYLKGRKMVRRRLEARPELEAYMKHKVDRLRIALANDIARYREKSPELIGH